MRHLKPLIKVDLGDSQRSHSNNLMEVTSVLGASVGKVFNKAESMDPDSGAVLVAELQMPVRKTF